MKQHLIIPALFFLITKAFSQTPQSIPYQAIVRDELGQPLIHDSIVVQLSLHNFSATGEIIYRETHPTYTDELGLFSLYFGMGTPTVGVFSAIDWANGYKFLQVECDLGSGMVDIGTQQLMSVPYALYAEKSNTTNISVSPVGDTLYLGNGNYVLIPGISNSNAEVETGLGATLLPGSQFCINQEISVSGCDGQESMIYQGHEYSLVEIAGQCWFQENLQADYFNDGTPITPELSSNWTLWDNNSANIPLYTYYDNNIENKNLYGNLYNAWCLESNNICPIGWHIPSECEWLYLFYKNGCSIEEISNYNFFTQLYGQNAFLAGKLLDTDTSNYVYPDQSFTPNNSSNFSAKLSGERGYGQFSGLGVATTFWGMNTQGVNGPSAFRVYLSPQDTYVIMSAEQNSAHGVRIDTDGGNFKSFLVPGRSIRCIKD